MWDVNTTTEPEILNTLVRIYPFCKRLLLHTHWCASEFTGTQRLVLLTSAVQGRLTMTHLAEAIACSKEQATRAVAPMVESGYLRRIYDPGNRTRVLIEITPQGRKLLRDQYEASAQVLRQQFSVLTQEEQDQLQSALSTVYRLLGRIQPDLPHSLAKE